MSQKKVTLILSILGFAALICLIIILFLYNGVIRFNYISLKDYPLQGLDVSHHQGVIEWDYVSKSGYSFVFIKATEGGDFVDPQYKDNVAGAAQYGLYTGAYHFFTFKKNGPEQAANFINTVNENDIDLPPVIDLEYMGNNSNRPAKEDLLKEISAYLEIVEEQYGVKPILYTTYEFYDVYLKGSFQDYPLWIRDIFGKPDFASSQKWVFWQYTNRGKVRGINSFVDLNAFNGDLFEFRALLKIQN